MSEQKTTPKLSAASGKLNRYLVRKRLSQGDFALLCNVSQGTVSRWLTGHAIPRLKVAVEIQDITKTIQPRDWFKQ